VTGELGSTIETERLALPDGAGEIEIGWHLHPHRWGRGYVTEAAGALLARGFADGLEEIWAVVDPANDRSIAVCRRLGMQLLGITDRWCHEPSMLFWAGATDAQLPSLSAERPAPPDRRGSQA
jgi:RimJ/RimL family protein N-acetyltransferase